MFRNFAMAVLLALGFGGLASSAAAQVGDGIAVHGHWKIEVFEPDGELSYAVEFENALMNDGKSRLVGLLAHTEAAGRWSVLLGHATGTNPACDVLGSPSECAIHEPDALIAGVPGVSFNLSATASGSGHDLILSGSTTANRGGEIDRVETRLGACPNTDTPAACGAVGQSAFTQKTLPSPVVVTLGQIVQVTVTLSFS